MKTCNISLVFLLALVHVAVGQTLSRSVLGTTGSTQDQLSYTVGETVIQTAEAMDTLLTQGFQQPDVLSGTFVDPLMGLTAYVLYPNPTSGNLSLELTTEGRREFSAEIVDVHGRIVLAPLKLVVETQSVTTFDVSHLATAGYVLLLRNREERVVKGIRFQKVD